MFCNEIYPLTLLFDKPNPPFAFFLVDDSSIILCIASTNKSLCLFSVAQPKCKSILCFSQAHKSGVFVEAELGVLSGVEDDISIDEKDSKYTNPYEVAEFVARTKCDSIAVAVGTSHGAYKFSGGQGIQFDILKEIQERIPNFPIVLHGGSSVNDVEIKRINTAGGQLNQNAAGVSQEEIVKAIKYGICKINIATDTRLLWTRVHREFFRDSPELFDPINPGKTYIEEYVKFMQQKFDLLGATGKAIEFN